MPLTTYTPVSGNQPTERSDIRIGYDEDFLYLMASLYDREPDGIQEVSLYRDRLAGDDEIVLFLDTFNDNESGRYFCTTPGGIRVDGLVAADGAQMDVNWNTYWDLATTRSQEGWFAEFRIPFSSLGFQSRGDTVEMGLIFFRIITRKDEIDVFPAISRENELGRPSLAQDVMLVGVKAGNPKYLTPYLAAGKGWIPELRPDGTAYHMETESPVEVGGDLRIHLSENLTLDLTANTDFAQVEADNQQVNLSRFSLFFPEKRQTFLERAGIFSFETGGRSRLFHSRHIGLVQGAPVRILGGARLVGRVGLWDLGAISMQTQAQDGIPSENFGVARVRRQVINPYSNAGAMIVSRIRDDGSYNVAYGLDTRIRVRGDDYFTLRWAQTFDDRVQEESGFRFQESALLQVQVLRERNEGFIYGIGGRWAGEDYWPGVGFQDRRDFTELSLSLQYQKLMGEESRFRRISPLHLNGMVVFRNEDRSVESAWLEYNTRFTFRDSGTFRWSAETHFEDLPSELSLPGNTSVPPGRYWFSRTEGGYGFPMGDLVRASFSGGVQQFYDGWLADFNISPSWRRSSHIQVGMDYRFVTAHFPDRGQSFDSHLVRTRIETALNTRLSMTAFVQLSSVADFAAANVRVRYNFREGQDLWLVYNEGWNLERYGSYPTLPPDGQPDPSLQVHPHPGLVRVLVRLPFVVSAPVNTRDNWDQTSDGLK
ncbi:DUF5916 domain-containing protein [Gemmatimonadota bacterium]